MTTTLISMVEFVSEQLETEQSPFEFKVAVKNYHNLLSLDRQLWMFVPCDEKGNPVYEPEVNCMKGFHCSCGEEQVLDCNEMKREWYKAKERVLFEGWKLQDPKKNLGQIIVYNDDFQINLDIMSCIQFVEGGCFDFNLMGSTVGQLADVIKGILLTKTAQNQLNNGI